MRERFRIYNDTDGIPAHPGTVTREEGERTIAGIRERVKTQGYYASVRGRIPIEDLALRLEPVPDSPDTAGPTGPAVSSAFIEHRPDVVVVDAGALCAAPASDDLERGSRIEAERVTLEFASRSTRRVDVGRRPITEAPLFGGPRQGNLFS